MKITASIREHLLAAARKEFTEAENNVLRLERELKQADSIRDEKRATLSWVEKLGVGTDLTAPAPYTQSIPQTKWGTLYYIGSKSGLTHGHYIERFSDGTATCSCPGFLNRRYCWASREVLQKAPTSHLWLLSRPEWNRRKEKAITNPK